MAKMFGSDTYLKDKVLDHSANGFFLLYIFFILVVTYWLYIILFHFPNPSSTIFGIFMIILYLIMNKPISKEIRLIWSYKYGLQGEVSIGQILANLPDSYNVISSVVLPGKKSNIDFVVIGPSGVYAIEVKSHRGRITYDGQQLLRNGHTFEHNFLWQVKSEARELQAYLRNIKQSVYAVDPILVFSNKYTPVRFGIKPVDSVHVIGAGWLLDTIQGNAANIRLTYEQIEAIKNEILKILPQST